MYDQYPLVDYKESLGVTSRQHACVFALGLLVIVGKLTKNDICIGLSFDKSYNWC